MLSSCGIYKPYTSPDVKTEGLYRDISIEDSTNLGNLPWQELFPDPYLSNFIQKGLENNTDLRVAHLRVTQAETALRMAKLSFLPLFGIDIQGVSSSFDAGKATNTYSLPLTASWEIDIFGKLRNAKKRTQAALEQSKDYEQAVQTSLVASIANMYYTLLLLDAQLDISEKTALNWKNNVKTMQALKEAGMTNEASVSQMEANYFMVEASVHDLQRQIYEVENSLSILLGDVPESIERGTLQDFIAPEYISVGIPLHQLANRPDIRAAERTLEQAFFATAEAKSAFYPSLVLNGSAGWTNNVGAMIINPGKLLLSAIGSLTQPLFYRGALRGNLKISQAEQEAAQIQFQQSILNAGSEVINALKQIETAGQKTSWREKQIASLEMAVTSTELLMKHGNATYLEVLTAQQSLLQAQLVQATDKFEEIQGVINLYHALGGGRSINTK